jgi:O-antigen ligase
LDRRKAALLLATAGLAGHAFFVPISIAGMQIALGVAAAGLLLAPPRPLRTALDWPIAAFVLVAIASDLWTVEGAPALAFATLWRPAIGFFVVAHALRLAPAEWRARVPLFAAAGLALASAVGLVQYRTGIDLVYMMHLRPWRALVDAPGVPGRFGAMGFFTSRLTFGHNASVLVALLAGALASSAIPRRQRWLAWGAGLLGLMAIALTFDRAAYFATAAALAVVALSASRRARMVLAAALAAALLAAALNGGVRGRLESTFSTSGNRDRFFLWSEATAIIRDHPLGGIGFGNYPRVCGRYYDRDNPAMTMRTWAHNLELSTLAETGPLGLLAVLAIFAAAALALLRRVGRGSLALGGLAALTALFVIAQAHDVLYDSKVMYALWLALGLSLSPAEEASPRSPPARAG